MRITHLWSGALLLVLISCAGEAPDYDELWKKNSTRIRTAKVISYGVDGEIVEHQRPWLLDSFGRYITLHGINLSGSNKFPPTESFPDIGAEVSYVGKPFPIVSVDEFGQEVQVADHYFGLLADLGFNSVRLLASWEAIEPYAKGEYDEEYLDYYEQLISIAADHGIYVLVDMHQDIFSRHLYAYYNEETPAEPGSLEDALLALVPKLDQHPPYSDWVRGDGAPRWVIEAALPEKNLDSPHWGQFRMLGGLEPVLVQAAVEFLETVEDPDDLQNVILAVNEAANENNIAPEVAQETVEILMAVDTFLATQAEEGEPAALPDLPSWLGYLTDNLPGRFEPWETCDMLPWTFWGVNMAISIDVERCYAAFFNGDKVFPGLEVDGQNIKDYLQEAYTNSFLELAKRAKKYDNVIGYDIMNEPGGLYILLTAAAALAQFNDHEMVAGALSDLLGPELGTLLHMAIKSLHLLPPNNDPETLAAWGLGGMDFMAVLDMNMAFDGHYLQPLYERVGQAIQKEDPNAIIWFEPGGSLRTFLGPGPQWDVHMTRLEGIRQSVYAPHHYFDIYPNIGFNEAPREFNPEEWTYRDFETKIAEVASASKEYLGNIPVVFGEFGTYYNFNGIDASIDSNYIISSRILDRYYEAFESLGLGRMVWCFSPENTYEYGDGWNKEDFSILDPNGNPRSWTAYVRPYARAASGKPVLQRFYSQHHFHDPAKGLPNPEREYRLEMESRETKAPTEIFVPGRQYPEGFYVWLSDGAAYFDPEHQILYWYPSRDEPDATHSLTIRPPLPDQDVRDWSYYFNGDKVLVGKGGVE